MVREERRGISDRISAAVVRARVVRGLFERRRQQREAPPTFFFRVDPQTPARRRRRRRAHPQKRLVHDERGGEGEVAERHAGRVVVVGARDVFADAFADVAPQGFARGQDAVGRDAEDLVAARDGRDGEEAARAGVVPPDGDARVHETSRDRRAVALEAAARGDDALELLPRRALELARGNAESDARFSRGGREDALLVQQAPRAPRVRARREALSRRTGRVRRRRDLPRLARGIPRVAHDRRVPGAGADRSVQTGTELAPT